MTRADEPREIEVGAPAALETAGVAASGGYRRLFGNRHFAALWFGQTISGVGDWLVVGLLIPLVTQISHGSSMAVAGIMIAKIIPSLILGSVLGVVVDRFDRRRLMVACDLINGVLCLGLIWTNSLFVIYAITFFMEICNLLFVPAKNAIIPSIVDERDLAAANGLSYTTQQASMLIGLLASGAIVAVFVAVVRGLVDADVPWVSQALAAAPYYGYLVGSRAGVALDSLSFALSAVLIGSIRVKRSATRADAGFDLRLLGADVIESFTVLKERPELRALLLSIGFAILGGGSIVSVGLVYVQQNLVGGVPLLAEAAAMVPSLKSVETLASQAPQTFMMAFLALGMFLGAVIVPRIAARMSLEKLFVFGIVLFGGAMFGFATTGIYWVASVFATVCGFLVAQVTVAGNTYISESVPDEVRGRVFTALESVLRVALLASMVIVAPIGDIVTSIAGPMLSDSPVTLTGSRVTLIVASFIVLAAAAYASRAIPWRTKDKGVTDDA